MIKKIKKIKRPSNKIIIIFILSILLIAGSCAWYLAVRETPESVLKKYLVKTAKLNEFSSVDTTSGTGSSSVLKGKLNLKDKNLILSGESKCSSKSDLGEVKIDADIQQEGAISFFRIKSVEGMIIDENGQNMDLRSEYQSIIGNWYKFEEEDKAIKALLDKDIFLLTSMVIAPGYDAEKIANVLLAKKAIVIESGEKVGDNYVLNIKINKSSYESAINELFPDLDNKDLIIDAIFYDESELGSSLTVKPDGTYISELSETDNDCYLIMQDFIGIEPLDLSKKIKIESKTQSIDGLTPIENYKSFSDFITDTIPQ